MLLIGRELHTRVIMADRIVNTTHISFHLPVIYSTHCTRRHRSATFTQEQKQNLEAHLELSSFPGGCQRIYLIYNKNRSNITQGMGAGGKNEHGRISAQNVLFTIS